MLRPKLFGVVGPLLFITAIACSQSPGGDDGMAISGGTEALTGCKGQASSAQSSSGNYYLTTFGNTPSDNGKMSCGESTNDGNWYYAASRQRFGCGAHIQITANGKCVVAETDDYGPDVCVENAAGGPIIDASPLVSEQLYGTSSAGWSDHLSIQVTVVDSSTPLGVCSASASGSSSGGSSSSSGSGSGGASSSGSGSSGAGSSSGGGSSGGGSSSGSSGGKSSSGSGSGGSSSSSSGSVMDSGTGTQDADTGTQDADSGTQDADSGTQDADTGVQDTGTQDGQDSQDSSGSQDDGGSQDSQDNQGTQDSQSTQDGQDQGTQDSQDSQDSQDGQDFARRSHHPARRETSMSKVLRWLKSW